MSSNDSSPSSSQVPSSLITNRFFCLNSLAGSVVIEEIKVQIPLAKQTAFSPLIYQCPVQTPLGNSLLFKQGKIIPMELSSAIAVLLLQLKEEDHFLDLCCAPGTKLAFAASLMHAKSGLKGSCTGVDISPHRICTARSLAKRFALPNVRLYQMDARDFAEPVHVIVPHSVQESTESLETNDLSLPTTLPTTFKELYAPQKTPFFASSNVRKRPGRFLSTSNSLYSKILVDVECSHDGSWKHIQKNGPPDLHPETILALSQTQTQILEHAIELLAPGGTLIYSTCSLMPQQNEMVVEKVLGKLKERGISTIEIVAEYFVSVPGDLDAFLIGESKYLKFLPHRDGTGGLFIAKLTKHN